MKTCIQIIDDNVALFILPPRALARFGYEPVVEGCQKSCSSTW